MTKAVVDDVQLLIPATNPDQRPDRVRFVFVAEGERQVMDVDIESARDTALWLDKLLGAYDFQAKIGETK